MSDKASTCTFDVRLAFRLLVMINLRVPCTALFLLLASGCTNLRELAGGLPDMVYSENDAELHSQEKYNRTRKAATTMIEGMQLYDNGNYKDAIEKFSAPEIDAAPDPLHVEALKYAAFSYCLIENYRRCRLAFEQAFSIDAGFNLLPSEAGHPMWGPVFEEAKGASDKNRVHMPTSRERARWRGIDPWRPR
ncbi:MAG: TssQ family T6SS-associated lipoprotein [Pseudomonadota bacterium]